MVNGVSVVRYGMVCLHQGREEIVRSRSFSSTDLLNHSSANTKQLVIINGVVYLL